MKNSTPEKSARDSMHSIIISFFILLLISASGVLGYMVIENYKFIDAIYMTIITIATVGFREVTPLSPTGKIFTVIIIIMSFGVFAHVLSNFTRYIVNGVFSNYYKINKVKKRIKALSNHVIVVGYGRNGKQTVEELTNQGEKVVLIETKKERIDYIQNETDILFIQGDATQDEILIEAGIQRAKALISALPIDADNLYVVLTARGLNDKIKIISRAAQESASIKLKHAGATNVIMPAKTGGQHMARLVAQPDIVEFLDYVLLESTNNKTSIEEVSCQEFIPNSSGKTIGELNIRKTSGVNIIGIRRTDGSYIVNPKPDVVITTNDHIFVLGEREEIETMKKVIHS